jgi:hypothetical protein
MNTVSRRQVLKGASVTAATTIVAVLPTSRALGSQATPTSGWRYVPLDATETAERAYRAGGGCAFAVTSGIVGQLAERHGEPYRGFPIEMMKYANGGLGLGSLCGAINAAAAMIGLFVTAGPARSALVRDLAVWHEQTELPTFVPRDAAADAPAVPRAAVATILCKDSRAAWQKATGTEQTAERCRRLAADVARKTVELLNAHHAAPAQPKG